MRTNIHETKAAEVNSKSNPKYDQKLDLIKKNKLTKADLLWFLKNIYVSRKTDDAEISMKKQNKAFFQISGAGHEGILSAVAKVLKPKHDYFIPYYRDRALCLGLGVTPYEMLCQANGNNGDTASHGRQMPAHWGNVKLNIVSKSSCTGTQFLQACGIAEAGLHLKKTKLKDSPVYNDQEIVYASCGDGTTAQGEFWEAMTTACVNKLPVLFMVEDNGYAISTPVWLNTPGGSISKAFANFPGLKIFTCDGNCPVDSYNTMLEVEKYMRAGNGPALVHANVTRPYSHSLSDDHSYYRTKDDLANEAALDVFNSYPKFLTETGLLTSAEIKAVMDEVQLEIREAMTRALATAWPDKSTYMDHLYSEIDPTSSIFESSANFSGKEDIPLATAINMTLKAEIK